MKKRYFPKIRDDECKGCERCVIACPKGVLALGKALNVMGLPHVFVAAEAACTGCSLCFYTCPEPGAISIIEEKEED
ncbi:MAG: 4Fe-4S dicluster domain-containing protein [Opitutales bacterium]|nr:4Fe-4S dicluster domain-containing protein [Opitutales bacterium]